MKSFDPECWYREICEDYKDGCQTHCAKYLKMKFLMEHSGIPASKCRPIPLQPEACDRDAFRRLADIKDNIYDFVGDGRNLYITSGNVGNGKTSWAYKLMLKYFEEVWSESTFDVKGVYVYVPKFLLMCKDFKTVDSAFEELKRNLVDVDLVIWDDIASTDISTYDLNQLLTYIDTRTASELSNIFTGNLPTRELLEQSLGSRLASRVWNTNTEIVEFKGGDRR